MISITEDKRMLGYESLSSYSNIFHFVTTRRGGCGKGTYASFNCSPYCGDDSDIVVENQKKMFENITPKPLELVIPLQTHGTKCLLIDHIYLSAPFSEKENMLNGVDALITAESRCCLCVSTADCVPILVYDKTHGVVGAIHSGWRGTVSYILRDTLYRMKNEFGTTGEDVISCIGPSISLASFEVGEEVYNAFEANGFLMPRISLRNKETGKHHIDLWEANRIQLLDFGVPMAQIELANICTYVQHSDFFSARRLGIKSGRILSGIMLSE